MMVENEPQMLFDDEKTTFKIILNTDESPSDTTATSFSPNIGGTSLQQVTEDNTNEEDQTHQQAGMSPQSRFKSTLT